MDGPVTAPIGASHAARERESFLAAQARHRAGARRWSIVLGLVVAAIALAISLLLAPLAWVVIGLSCDLLNLLLPMPDLLGALGRMLSVLFEQDLPVDVGRAAGIVVIAMLPGVLGLFAAWRRLGRIFDVRHADVLRASLGLREPHAGDAEERQLLNLVQEAAIAAGSPAPHLRLIDSMACNLAIVGAGADSTVIVTRGLLERLGRAQTQALVAQAVAALGDGDGLLAERLLRLGAVIGLLMLLSQMSISAPARAALRPLWRWRATGDDADFDTLKRALGGLPPSDTDSRSTTWRDWACMPLMGSLMIGVVVVPVGVFALLSPLSSLLWRRRRLLADAMAVRLTRDPQALAEAYAALSSQPTRLGLRAPWLGDLFLLDAGGSADFRVLSPYPSAAMRLRRLVAMGASVAIPVSRRIPVWAWLLGIPLAALLAGLFAALIHLGVFVSLALNSLFLALPAALLHALLRAIASH
jgi:Zn-dependent protease with chaperone function